MVKYAAAIFDVFGTMVDWRTGVATEVEKAFAAKDTPVDPWAFADEWRREYDPAMERIRSGGRGYVRLDTLHHENLETVLARHDWAGLFSDDEKADLNRAWEKLPPWPDVPKALARLKIGVIVAPCSNGSIALMTRLARFGGLSWDCIVGAEIAQNYKPEHEVYQKSARALGFEPHEVIMVACHNNDLTSARAAGLRKEVRIAPFAALRRQRISMAGRLKKWRGVSFIHGIQRDRDEIRQISAVRLVLNLHLNEHGYLNH